MFSSAKGQRRNDGTFSSRYNKLLKNTNQREFQKAYEERSGTFWALPPRGVLTEKLGGGMQLTSQNRFTLFITKICFLATLFMT